MEKENQTLADYMGMLTKDAEALVLATSDVAGEQVKQARERLAAALDSGKEMYQHVRDKAVEGAKATDQAVRERPYQAIGIAFGIGALLGCLLSRQCGRKDDGP
jgi:ElaB/YqjD/DUF883 family membrane-anchored ribosome-binding protein